MDRKIELLAPGGDVESVKSAILAGANAVYCGLSKFNARNRAANVSFEDLQGLLRLAHQNSCEIFLTLNTIILDPEIPALIKLLNRLVNTTLDGVIVQDYGMFYILNKYFPTLKIHASTQMTTHNEGQIKFVSKLKAERVNLSRELNIDEISALTATAHKNSMLTEVFVHGSYCISFSGICYISSLHGGNSGNRGRCSQPCRDRYLPTEVNKNFPLNMKDNSAYFDFKELYDAGVDSLKVEGRIKDFDYVYTIVNAWRDQIDRYQKTKQLSTDNSQLYRVFNRDFSNSFLKGNINKNMFIDNPMSYSTEYYTKKHNCSSEKETQQQKNKLFKEKDDLKSFVQTKIDEFDISKLPLDIAISGECGAPLKVEVKTEYKTFEIVSNVNLQDSGTEELKISMFAKRFKSIDDTEYFVKNMVMKFDSALYLPFKDLTDVKNRLLYCLNNSKKIVAPVTLPKIKPQRVEATVPRLSVLISSVDDVSIANHHDVDLYFQLPNSFKNCKNELLTIFRENKNLIPWFPSVLIGDNFRLASEFLESLSPKSIVSNNSGIAFKAFELGVDWTAGPNLNITNSYSLKCLKESFNCSGAFLSNELSKVQIAPIKKIVDFDLHYTIYQPITLMTSRVCLSHQVSDCKKHIVDSSCVESCEKYSTITNLKDKSFVIHKSKGNYHNLYNSENLLNTDIVDHYSNRLSSFMIDLRDVTTDTVIDLDKNGVVDLFQNYINDPKGKLSELLTSVINKTTNSQYKKGI